MKHLWSLNILLWDYKKMPSQILIISELWVNGASDFNLCGLRDTSALCHLHSHYICSNIDDSFYVYILLIHKLSHMNSRAVAVLYCAFILRLFFMIQTAICALQQFLIYCIAIIKLESHPYIPHVHCICCNLLTSNHW